MSSLSAIVVAAGSSRRMGFDKLEADLAGSSVLLRSLLAFEACSEVGEIRVVTSPEKLGPLEASIREAGLRKCVEVIEGGAERHLSVHRGLERVGEKFDLVAVHDGARPLVTPEMIGRCADAAREGGAAVLAHRVADTLKRGDDQGRVCGAVDRENLWAMETPQIFAIELLRRAYSAVMESGELVTDEVSAIEKLGETVTLVENTEPNGKITVPADLVVARAVIREREN
ncbi:MAG: 2-C-methyl-D-erythritol 4-phosphate cytidylyltransferase [Verrucomicrobiales bacterium]|jgi:2-C-methyl-D-erythritol 4-phosphate cytidylyltransferase|nr:2-C-methyl-D-erythritol 4-phosphate cytidylyltransferase [Verrucomicrobiales bacterium]